MITAKYDPDLSLVIICDLHLLIVYKPPLKQHLRMRAMATKCLIIAPIFQTNGKMNKNGEHNHHSHCNEIGKLNDFCAKKETLSLAVLLFRMSLESRLDECECKSNQFRCVSLERRESPTLYLSSRRVCFCWRLFTLILFSPILRLRFSFSSSLFLMKNLSQTVPLIISTIHISKWKSFVIK